MGLFTQRTTFALVPLLAAGCSLGTDPAPAAESSPARSPDAGTAELRTEGPEDRDADERSTEGAFHNVRLLDAHMQGQLGPVPGFNLATTDAFAKEYEASTQLEMHVEDPQVGWVMLGVAVSGHFGEPPLVAGNTVTMTSGRVEPDSNQRDTPINGGIGCTGAERGQIQYDVPASRMQLRIEEGTDPGQLQLNLVTRFERRGSPSSDQRVVAQATYPL